MVTAATTCGDTSSFLVESGKVRQRGSPFTPSIQQSSDRPGLQVQIGSVLSLLRQLKLAEPLQVVVL